MSRYFKYNYLNPNNFGTRVPFFRGCRAPLANHLKNLDDWYTFSGQTGLWILEDNVVNMQGAIKIEDGQTLCIAQDVLLQLIQDINTGSPRIRVLPGGKLNIYGTVKYFATPGGSAFMNIIGGDVLVRAGGSLINTNTGGGNGIINFNSGTFVNRGTFKNKGTTTIGQQPLLQLENYGTIVNTGTITPLSAIVNHPGSICIGC